MSDPAKVHASALVIDTHADTPQRFVDEHWNFTDPLNGGMLNYDSAKKGNLDAQFFSIWVDPNQYPANASARRTLELIDATLEQVRRAPDKLQLCASADDIIAAHKAGKFAVLMGIEGGHSIENSLGLLRDYYRLGVRYMTLTWSNTNNWADSSGDIDDAKIHHHNGLTPFGKQVVAEMNRLGMMVDVSHVSDKTFWDVIATTRTPIIASHSSARALTNAPRNLTDEMLLAMKKNNGVVMVNFFPAFIDENWRNAWNAQKPERKRHKRPWTPTTNPKACPSPTPPPTRSTASSPPKSAAPHSTHSSTTSITSSKSPASTTSASAPTSTASPSHPQASTPPPTSPKSPPPSWPEATPPKTCTNSSAATSSASSAKSRPPPTNQNSLYFSARISIL